NACFDSDKNFQIGFRTNLLRYFTGSRSTFNKHGDHQGTTIFAGATAMKQPSIIREPARRLTLGLSGSMSENPPRPFWGHKPTAFATIIVDLYRAAADPSISEMMLDLKGLSLGLGQAQELREAMTYFKSRGKHITCYLTAPNNIGYYIASAADRILIPPVCQLNLVGLRAELSFYAGTLEKLGARVDLMRIGDYKTASERFTQTAASEENREQVNRILDGIYNQFVSGIAEGRCISPDSVRNIIDNGPFTSAEALQYRLVDGLSYRDEVGKTFLSRMPEISFYRYHEDTLLNDDWRRPEVLAVVVADGDIAYDGRSLADFGGGTKATPRLLGQALERAVNTPEVKGIVLRVNSPGGLALAGEDIYRSAQIAADRKPLLVSMANVAASGGYYIAMSAERIYANPGTITGSIGIYG
ncbi:MAG: S49 family peptidase, partial [Candidatus Zixiibacteriota bacterium]